MLWLLFTIPSSSLRDGDTIILESAIGICIAAAVAISAYFALQATDPGYISLGASI